MIHSKREKNFNSDLDTDYNSKWRIKFNLINHAQTALDQVDSFRSDLDFNTHAIENFKKVQQSYFGFSYFMKNIGESSPDLKSFIY
ncbi:hypothetical protein BpHYR1_024644 [Brachionus plicatilis]|uniref:Uncharacterized protein n=1 Tax=Brachionus plicatilis TaxID=10195 RepID=A0A3M7SH37_BRAPC|nr:hypothetical protein BpHYR1_024644 [Brachionus plicatilis]